MVDEPIVIQTKNDIAVRHSLYQALVIIALRISTYGLIEERCQDLQKIRPHAAVAIDGWSAPETEIVQDV
jgi:hypothetical protein